jgi:transposase
VAPAATRGATLAGFELVVHDQFEPGLEEIERHRPAHIAKPDKTNGVSHRLPPRDTKILGVSPIGAVLLTTKTPQPELFRSGRQFAAWIGLTPKDHSTAGKVRLGGITRAGDEGLRTVLVVGATTVIQHAQRSGRPSPWLTELLKRKSPKLVAVALANKTARIAWKLMVTGENYATKSAPATSPGAA